MQQIKEILDRFQTFINEQKAITVPHAFKRVKVEPPKKVRKQYPFEGFINFQGLSIDVENKKGSYRRGTDPDGNDWKVKMSAHYGEVRQPGVRGTDGDYVDAFVGDNALSPLVVVVNQNYPNGAFDEQKCILGVESEEEAVKLYKSNYDKPDEFYGGHIAMNIGEFWDWFQTKKDKKKIKKKK